MRTLLLTCWLAAYVSSFAFPFQENNAEEFTIDVLNVRRGLLSNYVTKVVSDQYNFKYFATEGGITKFDGYDFSAYKPGLAFPGLENENIETLLRIRNIKSGSERKEEDFPSLILKKTVSSLSASSF